MRPAKKKKKKKRRDKLMRQINSHTLSSILGHGYHAKPIVERYLFLLKEEKGRWNPDFDTNFQLT